MLTTICHVAPAVRNPVVLALRNGPLTCREIAERISIGIASVSAYLSRDRVNIAVHALRPTKGRCRVQVYALTPAGNALALKIRREPSKVAKTRMKYKPCVHPLPWEDELWWEIVESQRAEVAAAIAGGFTDPQSISAAVCLPVSVVKRRMEEVA